MLVEFRATFSNHSVWVPSNHCGLHHPLGLPNHPEPHVGLNISSLTKMAQQIMCILYAAEEVAKAGAFLNCHYWVHAGLLHHHLVHCLHHQGQEQGDWLQSAITPGPTWLQDPEANRKDYSWPLLRRIGKIMADHSSLDRNFLKTPLWREDALHQDQDLTQEQFLSDCNCFCQQGPDPSLEVHSLCLNTGLCSIPWTDTWSVTLMGPILFSTLQIHFSFNYGDIWHTFANIFAHLYLIILIIL